MKIAPLKVAIVVEIPPKLVFVELSHFFETALFFNLRLTGAIICNVFLLRII